MQGKVSPAWLYVHIVLQLGGVVSGLGGFAIALLAFGWKQVPGQALYQPHKWMGIVVLVMALLQVRSMDLTCCSTFLAALLLLYAICVGVDASLLEQITVSACSARHLGTHASSPSR